MAVLKIEAGAKVKFFGKNIFVCPPSEELTNALQFNGENIEYNGEVLTFTEN